MNDSYDNINDQGSNWSTVVNITKNDLQLIRLKLRHVDGELELDLVVDHLQSKSEM